MGLTIFYRGILRNPDDIDVLINDASDICLEIGWRFQPIHRSNIMPAKGIWITPERSESIELTFLPNGRLYNCTHFLFTRDPEKEAVNEQEHQWICTKTGHAGSDTHMAIIKFLRYLSRKYFQDFELKDESHYWETNDEEKCRFQFGESEEAIEQMERAMNLMGYNVKPEKTADDDENMDSAASDMEAMLLRRQGFNMNPN